VKTDQLREARDEWVEGTRAIVRSNPLASNPTAMFAALILLPAVGLVTWAWFAQRCLRDVEGEALVRYVQRHGGARNGKELVTHAQQTAERQHCVGDLAGRQVDHEFLDVAQALAVAVVDIVAQKRVGSHEGRAGAWTVVSVHAEVVAGDRVNARQHITDR
jgi:hypothetical protein